MEIEQKDIDTRVELQFIKTGKHFARKDENKYSLCLLMSKQDGICYYYDYDADRSSWKNEGDLVLPALILPESKIVWQEK